jgi:hypothetical protein
MSDRAKTDEQKEEVLARILAVWKQYPHERLGQFLFNSYSVVTSNVDPFHIEDFQLVRMVEGR